MSTTWDLEKHLVGVEHVLARDADHLLLSWSDL
jgi:hypothetical protein